ncbi:MAG: hypothetical protein AB4372_38775 [Xenococcus sp. (in: cyanobacteria)]
MKTQRPRKIRVSKLLYISLLVVLSTLLTKIYPVASQDSQKNETFQIQPLEIESKTKDSTPETTEDSENQIPNVKELNDSGITTIEEPENRFGVLLSRIEEQLLLFFSVLINFLLAFVAFWLKQNEKQLQKTASKRLDQLTGLKSLPKVSPNTVINSVIVIGLGGSGKTSLCRLSCNYGDKENLFKQTG